jgi:hypothetical protein
MPVYSEMVLLFTMDVTHTPLMERADLMPGVFLGLDAFILVRNGVSHAVSGVVLPRQHVREALFNQMMKKEDGEHDKYRP